MVYFPIESESHGEVNIPQSEEKKREDSNKLRGSCGRTCGGGRHSWNKRSRAKDGVGVSARGKMVGWKKPSEINADCSLRPRCKKILRRAKDGWRAGRRAGGRVSEAQVARFGDRKISVINRGAQARTPFISRPSNVRG